MTAKTTSPASLGSSKRSVSVLLPLVRVGAASGLAASTVMRPVTGCGKARVISETFSPRSFFGMRIFSTWTLWRNWNCTVLPVSSFSRAGAVTGSATITSQSPLNAPFCTAGIR